MTPTPPTDARQTETELHRGHTLLLVHRPDPTGGSLVLKRAVPGADAAAARAALGNEHRILERLAGIAGCPRLVHYDPARPELAVADFPGATLAGSGLMGRLGLPGFLALAEALARTLAEVHARGVVHRDLNPAHILVRTEEPRVQLIAFGMATTFAEEHPDFAEPARPAGTLAWLSPEQTGRMNRTVDYRTDLYSLGAVLYAMATGAPPFTETDPLGLIHAHLARSPTPPRELAAWLPARLSDLILTLLAKEPDDRYQSAAGLAYDLARLREAQTAGSGLKALPLRTRDLPLTPRPPNRLHGRVRELAALTATLERAVSGAAVCLFVAGYAGVGKTALIRELHRPVTLAQGLFVDGKCEQFQRDRPFLAPSQCLRQLCQLLLAGPEEQVRRWRERASAGLGPDAGALYGVVPELEALLGPRPEPPPLGPLEAQVRLRALLVALVRQVAAPAHPLVLFLDDLQWADQPSLDFIGALLDEPGLAGLFLIGAYRDQELETDHPLRLRLKSPTAAGTPPPVLCLESLREDDLGPLLADLLHTPPAALGPLAAALYARTQGNPFFTIALVNALYREGHLTPNPEQGSWHWDQAALLAHPASDNLAELLAAGLGSLPLETAEALVAAACLGNACTLAELALATGLTADTLAVHLMPALEQGVLITPNALALSLGEPDVALRFCHDRMQQAAYLLWDDERRRDLHLAMARRFAAANLPGRAHAAEHYAAALPLVTEPGERARARALLQAAAVGARRAGDYATAERFLRLGIELLPAGAWQDDHAAVFALHAELHLVLYSQARAAEADAVFALLLANPGATALMVEPSCVQMANLTNRTLYREAILLGRGQLARHGVAVPLEPLDQGLQGFYAEFSDVFRLPRPGDSGTAATISAENPLGQEFVFFYQHLAAGALERLPERADLTDAGLAGAARIMNGMLPAANNSHPILTSWLVLRLGRLWIEDGYSAATVFPMVCAASPLIGFRGDFATAERLALTALKVGAARERSVETARGLFVYAHYVCHWLHPAEEDVQHARAAFRQLLRAGDEEIAAFAFYPSQAALLDTGTRIDELETENAAALRFSRKAGNRHTEQSYLPYRQLIRALEGRTAAPGAFADHEFDEAAYLTTAQGNLKALCYFHLCRALAACLFRDPEAHARHAAAALRLSLAIHGHYATALLNVLHSLTLLEQVRTAEPAGREPLLARVALNQAWLAARAAAVPKNFAHLHALVAAERLDALERPAEAYLAFEQAMREAQAHARPWHRALITERTGACMMRRGLEHAARALLGQAHALYRDWGAHGKARAMRADLPFLSAAEPAGAYPLCGEALDYEALLRASQALASERSLPRLVARVTELVAQLTGATDVRLLVLDDADRWYLEGGRRGTETLGRMTREEAEARRLVAARVLRLGLKTRAPVIAEDAVIDSRFTSDPYFAGMPRAALLALPVLLRGRVGAFLILENRLLRAAFSDRQVETLSLLSGQLAISIDNARLYRSLEDKVAERERALKQVYQRLTAVEVERSRTAERERLLQDMHDGFGSQLASARLRIERGGLSQDQVAFLLHQCLDDLHLVVDTMGDDEKTLGEAIADYRYRCDNRLAGQSVQVAWTLRLDDCPPLRPRQTLQVLRIIQEALNNALRHARAGRIEVSAVCESPERLRIDIIDDGVGIPAGAAQGRGIGNMQNRAREIGGRLEFIPLAPGTRVCLTLPVASAP